MAMQPFIWGAGGEQMTPEQVERRRLAALLQGQRASDTSPVQHWTQAAARGLNGYLSGRGEYNATQQENAGLASADLAIQGNPVLSALMGGQQMGGGGAVPAIYAPGAVPVGNQYVADVWVEPGGEPQAAAMPVNANPGVAGAFAGSGGLPSSIVQSESGGNWNALNSEGYGGRGQFGADRLADAARAGVIPAGMTGLSYSKAPEAVQLAVEEWHKGDIMNSLGQYVGVDPDGPGPIPALTPDSLLAVAHLGGTGGAKRFVESGGQYNPSDSNGTSLADYAIRHAGGPQAGAMPQGMMGSAPQAPSGVVAALAAAQSNPWVAQKYGPVINALMEQEMGRQDLSYQQQLQAQDPYRQAQIAQMQAQTTALQNPTANMPASFQALDMQAQAAGLQPGTEPYQQFMLNGGAGGSSAPAAFQALDMQAQAAGFIPGTPEYREFMASRGAGYVAQASAEGAARGDAVVGMDSAIQSAERNIANLQMIRDDPNLPSITGMVQGRLPPMTQGGTDLNTRIQQAQGAAFLEAFESLKGGGAITEVEGTKAEQAMARLNRAQSTEAYQGALNELIDVLNIGIGRARSRAGQPAEAAAPAAATPARRRYNPETGAFE